MMKTFIKNYLLILIILALLSLVFAVVKGQDTSIDYTIGQNVLATPDEVTALQKEMEFQKTVAPKLFIPDRRTVKNLTDGDRYNPMWAEWKEIYKGSYPIAYIPATLSGVKMIAEMKATIDTDSLNRELAHFKTLGYNSVLAVWQGEDVTQLFNQIENVKSMGFRVWFTYGTGEEIKDKIFIDPTIFKISMKLLASQCDGYILGWRRTALHLFKDAKFSEYCVSLARQGNPTITILGEVYQGITEIEGANKLSVNIPANSSGVLVVNYGYINVIPKGVKKRIVAKTELPLLALIVGECPYYKTTNNTGKTNAQNRVIISSIEKRFRDEGFGTITLSGDGSSDDISKQNWSK